MIEPTPHHTIVVMTAVFGVHCVGGIFGALATGIFASASLAASAMPTASP